MSRTQLWLVALLVLAAGTGCKERGTVALDIEFDGACMAPFVTVFLARNQTCDMCRCDDCMSLCVRAGEDCTSICSESQPCSFEEFEEQGIAAVPPRQGQYAVIYRLIAPRAGGGFETVAGACADVEVDSDGTASSEKSVPGYCCGQADAGPGPDAAEGL